MQIGDSLMKWRRIAITSLMTVAVLAAVFSLTRRTEAQTTNQLAGTYRLISIKLTLSATGETIDVMGKAPKGYIIYGKDGRMMVLYVNDERPNPKNLDAVTDQERVDLFKTMNAYSGRYDFDGKVVTHHIEVSGNQTWTGTHQVRNVKFDGKRVILTTNPQVTSFGGKVGVVVNTWERVD
jgi:hypothetical protein